MSERRYSAVCTAGCVERNKAGVPLGPRRLDAQELAAHDDKHVSEEARVLVRMLRDVSPEVRGEVLRYFAHLAPVYARPTEAHKESA
jgi:hypothetical protein